MDLKSINLNTMNFTAPLLAQYSRSSQPCAILFIFTISHMATNFKFDDYVKASSLAQLTYELRTANLKIVFNTH